MDGVAAFRSAFCHFFQHIFRDVQFTQCHWDIQRYKELSCFGNGFAGSIPFICGSVQMPYIPAVFGKHLHRILVKNIFHPYRCQNRKAYTMCHIKISAEGVFHSVYTPWGCFAVFQKAVDCLTGRPHQICTGFVVVRLFYCDWCIVNTGLQNPFC